MSNIRFTRKSIPKKRFKIKKEINMTIENPNNIIISKTRRSTRKTFEKLRKMNESSKRGFLEKNGIINTYSKAPNDIINLIITNIV